MLKKERIIDSTANTSIYVNKVTEDMGTPLDTYFKTQVKEKYQDESCYVRCRQYRPWLYRPKAVPVRLPDHFY